MKHPYEDAPAYRRWRTAVADVPLDEVDPLVSLPFKIAHTDRIVTAGSCFAQYIARHLRQRGFNYLETERAHPLLPPAVATIFNYGIYSARYGNVYTSRQLLQLLRRAYGHFRPAEDVWILSGRYFDPFRPSIQPNGFASPKEYELDRRQHFAAIRQAFETMDYFIFTLGLTEGWLARVDGAAYPICPGVVAGEFDPQLYTFANDGVWETHSIMLSFIEEVRQINPQVKILLTVSPVPLAATAEDKHVLAANTYSKSVLRVVAEMLTKLPGVHYFPAYEIVTGIFSRGSYFDEDLRSIREEGIRHVMDVFFRHATLARPASDTCAAAPILADEEDFSSRARLVTDTMCEETKLDPSVSKR